MLRKDPSATSSLRSHAKAAEQTGPPRQGGEQIGPPEESVAGRLRELEDTLAKVQTANLQLEEQARQLGARLRASQERYKTLLEQASDAIFLLDPLGKVVEINRRAEELLGLSRADIIDQSYQKFVPPAELDREQQRFRELLAEGTARAEDAHLLRADGSQVCVDLSASVVQQSGDSFVFAIAHDISERNRLEERSHQSQKMEALGRLAGGVAHDFNNLLTVINGYGELLLGSLPSGEFDSPREIVTEIMKAGERAASLTRQLLAFSRQQVIVPQVLDMNSILLDTAKMLRRLIGEDIELTTALSPALGRVRADPGQIEQIILNLALNARDAMPQGGKLTVETKNVVFDENTASLQPELRPGRYALLAVTDTGCGMEEQTKAHIFEPFFTTKGDKGTGLGLATVYGIVKQNEGCINVYSEVGRGTTFKVYLPRVEASFILSRAIPLSQLPPAHETVLLAEDEETVRTLTRRVLERLGYTVLEAARGQEALHICEQHQGPIHLLITDVVMPQMSGKALADRLATLRPQTKVLFLSGYTDDAVFRHGLLEGEAAFLQKPFTLAALARKVRSVLDNTS